jgi:hypothetical protein
VAKNKQQFPTPTIGRHAQDRIGRELRIMYAGELAEPLPDVFLMLLRALSTAEAAQDRLFSAVLDVREAHKEFGLTPTAPLTTPMSVRAQQVLLAREMLQLSRKPSGEKPPGATKSVASGSRPHARRATSRRASL